MKYNSIQEKISAHEIRLLNHLTYTTARLLVEDDIKRGCSSIAAWGEINNYINECKPIVANLIAGNYPHIYIPRQAMKLYIKLEQ